MDSRSPAGICSSVSKVFFFSGSVDGSGVTSGEGSEASSAGASLETALSGSGGASAAYTVEGTMPNISITAVTQLLQVEVMLAVPSERRGLASTAFMLMGDIGNGAGAAIWGAVSAGAGYVLTYALAGLSSLMGCLFHGAYWKKRK